MKTSGARRSEQHPPGSRCDRIQETLHPSNFPSDLALLPRWTTPWQSRQAVPSRSLTFCVFSMESAPQHRQNRLKTGDKESSPHNISTLRRIFRAKPVSGSDGNRELAIQSPLHSLGQANSMTRTK